MNENPNIIEVTIRVDVSPAKSVTLDHVCAKCGMTAQSIPVCYDALDRATGRTDGGIFTVRSAIPPDGWEHIRIQYASGNGTKHVEVCPECVRAFFRWTTEAK